MCTIYYIIYTCDITDNLLHYCKVLLDYCICIVIVVHSSLMIMLLLQLLYLILPLIMFCFIMKNSTPPLHPLWPGLGRCTPPPSKSIPDLLLSLLYCGCQNMQKWFIYIWFIYMAFSCANFLLVNLTSVYLGFIYSSFLPLLHRQWRSAHWLGLVKKLRDPNS